MDRGGVGWGYGRVGWCKVVWSGVCDVLTGSTLRGT